MVNNSLEVAKYATRMAISSREEEDELKIEFKEKRNTCYSCKYRWKYK